MVARRERGDEGWRKYYFLIVAVKVSQILWINTTYISLVAVLELCESEISFTDISKDSGQDEALLGC